MLARNLGFTIDFGQTHRKPPLQFLCPFVKYKNYAQHFILLYFFCHLLKKLFTQIRFNNCQILIRVKTNFAAKTC